MKTVLKNAFFKNINENALGNGVAMEQDVQSQSQSQTETYEQNLQ